MTGEIALRRPKDKKKPPVLNRRQRDKHPSNKLNITVNEGGMSPSAVIGPPKWRQSDGCTLL